MAILIPRYKLGLLLGGTLALVSVWHAIWVDPTLADVGESEASAEELATTETIRERALAFIEANSKYDNLHKRDAHLHPHGCVTGEFRVLQDLEDTLRRGVFSTPGQSYPAWVRFSNGTQGDDTKPDGRGMAIKLMGVPGEKILDHAGQEETQDFVMVNHHTFILRDVDEYLEFFDKQVKGEQFGYFIGWNPFKWQLRELRVGLEMLLQDVPSPLATSYFSMLPFKYGDDQTMKYSAVPCDPKITERCEPLEMDMPEVLSAHYLRDALVADLTPISDAVEPPTAARFEFQIQLQDPSENMPIEDATIEWSQARVPYVTVAELTIPMQRFDSDEQNQFCENLSFNGWHALPAHRPVGGLNRARKVLYEAISKRRHERNGVPRHEPRGHCLRLDGEPCVTEVAEGGAQ